MTPELQAMIDIYLDGFKNEDFETYGVENLANGKTVWSQQEHFFSLQPIEHGIVFLFSRKQSGILSWDNIWSIKRYEKHSKFVELTLVAKDEFSGEKKLVIPWREEFWILVPEPKVCGTIELSRPDHSPA